MKVTVEFKCPRCGLLTPGMAELPRDIDPRGSVVLQHECFHCDAKLEKKFKVSLLIQLARAEPIPVGSVLTIDAQTGNVTEERKGGFMLMPPAPNVCQVCASDHPPEEPHNANSMYYQVAFAAAHGRPPTWTDAMAHCDEGMKKETRRLLVATMKEHGLDIPEDLRDGPEGSQPPPAPVSAPRRDR